MIQRVHDKTSRLNVRIFNGPSLCLIGGCEKIRLIKRENGAGELKADGPCDTRGNDGDASHAMLGLKL